MAWVRYDDNFHDHDKVAILRAECPEALSLHLLANTWTSRTSRPGFVPTPIPTVLVGKAKAKKWAPLLVAAELWHAVEGGWEFVNHARYRNSEKRQTAGTPDDLSEKRAAAGRRGGTATAAKKAANGAANEATAPANVQQASSNPCSPVVASNEATPEPGPVPTSSALAVPAAAGADTVVAAFVDGATTNGMSRPGPRIIGQVAKSAAALLGQGQDPDALLIAARRMGANGWDNLEREVRRVEAEQRPQAKPSTTDAKVASTLALAERFREQDAS
jgi:hypothetical protein